MKACIARQGFGVAGNGLSIGGGPRMDGWEGFCFLLGLKGLWAF